MTWNDFLIVIAGFIAVGGVLLGVAHLAGRAKWADGFLTAAGLSLFLGCLAANLVVLPGPEPSPLSGPERFPVHTVPTDTPGPLLRLWRVVSSDPPTTAARLVSAVALLAYLVWQVRRSARPGGRADDPLDTLTPENPDAPLQSRTRRRRGGPDGPRDPGGPGRGGRFGR